MRFCSLYTFSLNANYFFVKGYPPFPTNVGNQHSVPGFEHSSCPLWLQTAHRAVCLTRRALYKGCKKQPPRNRGGELFYFKNLRLEVFDEDGEFVEDNVEAVRAGVGIADGSFSDGARSA